MSAQHPQQERSNVVAHLSKAPEGCLSGSRNTATTAQQPCCDKARATVRNIVAGSRSLSSEIRRSDPEGLALKANPDQRCCEVLQAVAPAGGPAPIAEGGRKQRTVAERSRPACAGDRNPTDVGAIGHTPMEARLVSPQATAGGRDGHNEIVRLDGSTPQEGRDDLLV